MRVTAQGGGSIVNLSSVLGKVGAPSTGIVMLLLLLHLFFAPWRRFCPAQHGSGKSFLSGGRLT
jgi:hypothetical protein